MNCIEYLHLIPHAAMKEERKLSMAFVNIIVTCYADKHSKQKDLIIYLQNKYSSVVYFYFHYFLRDFSNMQLKHYIKTLQ